MKVKKGSVICPRPLEKRMATYSSILAWRLPWTEEPGGLQSMGSQGVRHDWATNTHTYMQLVSIRRGVWMQVSLDFWGYELSSCYRASLAFHSVHQLSCVSVFAFWLMFSLSFLVHHIKGVAWPFFFLNKCSLLSLNKPYSLPKKH